MVWVLLEVCFHMPFYIPTTGYLTTVTATPWRFIRATSYESGVLHPTETNTTRTPQRQDEHAYLFLGSSKSSSHYSDYLFDWAGWRNPNELVYLYVMMRCDLQRVQLHEQHLKGVDTPCSKHVSIKHLRNIE